MKNNRSHQTWVYALCAAFLFLFALTTLLMGETPWEIVWTGIKQRASGGPWQWNPLLDERLPRLIVILCTGASLAVSGAVMQALFHNPLASPSVLGITSGGSLVVVFVFIFGWHNNYPFLLPMSAVGGCFMTLLVVYSLSQSPGNSSLQTLILSGIAISTVLMATQSAIIYAYRDHWQLIQTLTEWEAGSTADRGWHNVHMQLPLTLIGLTGCWAYRNEMNILALGEEEAKNLGVEVDTVRWRLFLCIALLTGGAIAAVGIIAYFGLVLPNLIRRTQGPDNRSLIPLCIIIGSTLLLALDLFLRFFSIHTFSIGNISAIIGGGFFLTLLFNRKTHFAQGNYVKS